MQKEFMTIGELARLMGTTVRTLQYYDKQGLLKPAAFSEGGHRLYSAKEVVKLHQILSFKFLGFSLDEIKSSLFSLDDPKEVAGLLEHQKGIIQKQLAELEKAQRAIDTLHQEVTAIREVDFAKYAEIIELLKLDNNGYWAWKRFDDPLKEHVRSRFGDNAPAALQIFDTYKEVLEEALLLKRNQEPPEGEKGQCLARKWWDMILEFTGGDMTLVPKLEVFNENKEGWDSLLAEKQKEVDVYLNAALENYLAGGN